MKLFKGATHLTRYIFPRSLEHVPSEVVQTVADIIEFCHLVRRSVVDEDTLVAINASVSRFHLHREIFRATVRPEGFTLPRQHSIVHYRPLIQMFWAPNGLCSSITESKHIKAVKKSYKRTNHNKPLSQMLLTNQRLDKLAAARDSCTMRGMLDGALLPPPLPPRNPSCSLSPPPEHPDDERVDSGTIGGPTCIGEVKLAKTEGASLIDFSQLSVHELSVYMEQPHLHELIRCFLLDQLNPDAPIPSGRIPLDQCPDFAEWVFLYTSARAVSYALSDVSGVGGMHHERIRATKRWYRGPPRYGCVFLKHDRDLAGFQGLHAARVRMLFRFKYRGIDYPCALIHWFSARGEHPCPDTGM
ncbi:hypothetical protein DFH09DRAFT_1362296 [Mycena vulgaris]|nr:hypothetical protein DFH09DRAFT_1362296 [Mycena vulgaris]